MIHKVKVARPITKPPTKEERDRLSKVEIRSSRFSIDFSIEKRKGVRF